MRPNLCMSVDNNLQYRDSCLPCLWLLPAVCAGTAQTGRTFLMAVLIDFTDVASGNYGPSRKVMVRCLRQELMSE